jgi:hypothetical protein
LFAAGQGAEIAGTEIREPDHVQGVANPGEVGLTGGFEESEVRESPQHQGFLHRTLRRRFGILRKKSQPARDTAPVQRLQVLACHADAAALRRTQAGECAQ